MDDTGQEDVKVKIRIMGAEGDESDEGDETSNSAEVLAVKAKLESHHIKRMSTLLKPSSLASVDKVLERLLKAQLFAIEDGSFRVDFAPVVLHGGMWRWMPDFALKPVPAETGRLHIGCMIGPYVVDWTDSSLVAIRTLASCEPLVLVRLPSETLYSGRDVGGVDAVLRSAARVIVQWNTSRKYDAKKCTPYAFFEELWAALGARLQVPAPIAETLRDAQRKGVDKVELSFFAEWAVVPGDKKAKKTKFKSHAELDEWVLARRKEHPSLETEHVDDWNMLLLLDRLCWCGQEGPDQDTMSAKDKPRAEGCPFGPPAFHKVLEMDLGGGPKRGQMVKKKTVAM